MLAERRRRLAVLGALGTLGVVSQLAQGALGRELLTAFHGNEVSLGAFFGGWLAWVGVGALAVARRSARIARPERGLAACLLVLPLALAAQVLAARLLYAFLDVPSAELVPLGQLLVATLALTAPAGLALGAAFPLGCKALGDERSVSRLYVLEALGALGGGALFTFVLLPHLHSWRTIGVAGLVAGGAAAALGARRRGAALAAAAALLAVTPAGARVAAWTERARFRLAHPDLELVATAETRFGHVAVGRRGGQYTVAYDGRVADTFPDPQAAAPLAAYLAAQAQGPRRVLLLGGAASGVPAELLGLGVTRLDLVEGDPDAFAVVARFLPDDARAALADPRLTLHLVDDRRFVNGLPPDAAYDLVAVLGAEPQSAHLNRVYTRELYERARAAMAPGGVLCTRLTGAANYLGRDVAGYGASVHHTLAAVFPEVVATPGETLLLCAGAAPGRVTDDGAALARRYAALPAAGPRLPPETLAAMLPPEQTAYTASRLAAAPAELNTDLHPTTYFSNMLLWGRFTSSGFVGALAALRRAGPWWLLGPALALFAALLGRSLLGGTRAEHRRDAACAAAATLGFVAMAAQLVILFAYQARVGAVYGRIALLGGAFMAGLALGGALGRAAAASRAGAWGLPAVLAAAAALCLALPRAFATIGVLPAGAAEPAFFALSAALGLVTGAGFPLAVRAVVEADPDTGRAAGQLEAADHLGGAAGGLLCGGFLVPLLGTRATCTLAAALLAAAAVPLLRALAGFPAPAARLPWLAERARPSFPFRRATALLVSVAVAVLAGAAAMRRAAPGPVLSFEDAELAAVSGSARFDRRDAPFVHAVGASGEAAPARTVSLSTMTVAADVRGYAGPVNLLVAVDDAGVLRGVRYVDSHETPSYLRDLPAWLDGLAGRDLRAAPLTADNVDVVTGATVTGEACLRAINRAAGAGARAAFGVGDVAPGAAAAAAPPLGAALRQPRTIAVALLLVAFFPVFLRGGDRARLGYLVAALAVLGFGWNTALTEMDLANLSVGRLPSLAANPGWALLLGFAALTSILWGQVYCGYVCPFGAVQELVSRAGRRLGLRAYAHAFLETRLRWFKYVLLTAILVAWWVTREAAWVAFDPMQHVFGGWSRLAGWTVAVAAVATLGALFYYRFWCRYFCPMGAFLALGNKLALLRRVAPRRVFSRCDLGVRAEHDVDCVQCNRCITGVDLGTGRRDRA